MTPPVLIVEDTPTLQALYAGILASGDFTTQLADTAERAREIYAAQAPQVVLIDLTLPDGDGIQLMKELLSSNHQARFIVITADGSVDRAVESMRSGASEFLVKPFDDAQLLSAVRDALRSAPGLRSFRAAQESDGATPPASFIGSSPAIRHVYEIIQAVSRSKATVFITGESGTGKEICARAVHATSSRADGPFIPINCGAISPDHLESEVFGHLKGSFPGALADKEGAAALANGGTLFLDGICEMDMHLQVKLLRFLQTSEIAPVGSTTPRKVDVRIVAATNRDPQAMVAQGRMREDLYYRLHVVPIAMPPLRDRGDDVLEIADAMLRRFNATESRNFLGLTSEVRSIFRRYAWPGNVRQLGNVLWNIVLLNEGPYLTSGMLPPLLLEATETPPQAPPPSREDPLEGLTLAEAERLLIERAIDRAGGSVPRAARALDVSASTLYRKRALWQEDERSVR
ncbi:sigma-54-dependent transcriptional regulator [Roseitranquillus sediminis]|uniref:sigma-54-dependent transcriptional regulator n=1 Tax=Roseitranquillus sediminis TaxID=2809051 RepID=UPI001D0C641D|nr:sigma-54 dependent transcriptional regulator [Roseitranquillus sediminis]MBM9594782.1 sigma-54-dependent Fis family transcriptional regulator [Roseitranquillus sediminis]